MNNSVVPSKSFKGFRLLSHAPIAAFLAVLLFYSRRSLDFSDESLYLYLTSSPTQESTLAGVWNWYLNFLYRMSGEDIVLYRQISIFVTFACSYFFAWAYFSSTSNPKNTKDDSRFSFLPIVATTISIVFFYRTALLTPGYNWLALIGVLISIAGAVKWLSGERSLMWPAISVVGLGFATMARPTAGILIFFAMLTYRKIRTDIFRMTAAGKTFFTTFIIYVLFHHLFVISISGTMNAWQQTLSTSQIDKSHSFMNLLLQAATDVTNFPLNAVSISRGLILVPICVICANFFIKSKADHKRFQSILVLGALATYVVILITNQMLLIMNHLFMASPESRNKVGLTLATLTFFGFLSAVALGSNRYEAERRLKARIGHEYSGSAIGLLVAGIFGYAFSSNNGLLNHSAGIGILYVALYLQLFLRINQQQLAQRMLISNVIFLLIMSSQVVYGAWQHPYRSVSLSENIYSVTVGGDSKILVSKSRAEEISKVKAIANKINAKDRNLYLVDLSPFTTFIPYQLEFKTIETPLIVTPSYLEGFAQRNKSKLQSAWIMTSDSKKSVDPTNLLRVLGKTIEHDYELAYTLDGNFCRNLPCRLTLWKPR